MQLIPQIINPNTKSDAERLIFQKLQKSKIEGVAIHSLDLSEHESKLYSEIDFVVITGRGVLCLEVKGGDVRLDNGKWEYIDRSGISHFKEESPFTQARSNKESLMQYVRETYKKKNGSEIKRCVYGYGVVFPDTIFHERGAGIDLNIVFDDSTENFDDYLIGLYDLWEERISDRLNLSSQNRRMQRLNTGHISLLEELLIGKTGENKETIVSKNFFDVDGKLKELSDEQYKVFQYGIQNRRQLIEGGAGTGKTLIAMKYAIEKAKEGNQVLLLCFNKLLADWVGKNISFQTDDDLGIKVINFHEYLMEITGLEIPENRSDFNEFFKRRLPDAFMEMVDSYEPFDTLVVDEGQDLLFENYLLCIDQFVTGGLSHGNWIVMYDENQNIYLRDELQSGLEEIKSYNPFFGQLRENYRNTRQIVEANEELTHIHPMSYVGLDGEKAEVFEYADNLNGQRQLKSIVKGLRKKGVPCKDIVILSQHRLKNSILEGKRQLLEGIAPIQPMQSKDGTILNVPDHVIKYSSIYSFKGLEAHVVIIIGMDKDDEVSRRLFYTGISRAKSKLFVLKKVDKTKV